MALRCRFRAEFASTEQFEIKRVKKTQTAGNYFFYLEKWRSSAVKLFTDKKSWHHGFAADLVPFHRLLLLFFPFSWLSILPLIVRCALHISKIIRYCYYPMHFCILIEEASSWWKHHFSRIVMKMMEPLSVDHVGDDPWEKLIKDLNTDWGRHGLGECCASL